MKTPTTKQINDALPRFDWLRRHWCKFGTTGWLNGRNYLNCAIADVDKDGDVTIHLYAVGDAMERRHYNMDDGCFDITDIIEDGFYCDCVGGDARSFRRETVRRIRELIEEEMSHDEE